MKTSHLRRLIVALALAASLLSACLPSKPPAVSTPSGTRVSQGPRLTVVHGRAPDYTVSLQIPAIELPAGSSQVASVTVTNTSDAVLEFYPPVGVRVFDQYDRVVYTTPRKRMRHPDIPLQLSRGQAAHFDLAFVVPKPGVYALCAVSSDGTETPSTTFRSVARE